MCEDWLDIIQQVRLANKGFQSKIAALRPVPKPGRDRESLVTALRAGNGPTVAEPLARRTRNVGHRTASRVSIHTAGRDL